MQGWDLGVFSDFKFRTSYAVLADFLGYRKAKACEPFLKQLGAGAARGTELGGEGATVLLGMCRLVTVPLVCSSLVLLPVVQR